MGSFPKLQHLLLCWFFGIGCATAQSNITTPNSPWPAVQEATELDTVEIAADYVVSLLNLRNVFPTPTILDRVIVAYRCPLATYQGKPLPTRYFIVMDVNDGDDPFVLMVETYQDDLKNWQPIMPSAAKNFRMPQTTLVDVNSELWFAAFPKEAIVASALDAARYFLEKVYYPSLENGQYLFEALLLSEVRSDPVQPVIQRRKAEMETAYRRVNEAKKYMTGIARSLSATLAIKQSRMHEYSIRKDKLRGVLETNATRDDDTAVILDEWIRFYRDHRREAERLDQDADLLEAQLKAAEAEIHQLRKEMERAQEDLRATSSASAVESKAAPVHAFLVMSFLPSTVAQINNAALREKARQRRQVVLYNPDWQAKGFMGWELLVNQEFAAAYH